MKFKNIVRSSLNEMALKHLKGTQQYWDDLDYELVANKYIKNALADGLDFPRILKGLNVTFGAKRFKDKKGQAEEVKKLVRKKIKEMQGKDLDKPKSILLKKKGINEDYESVEEWVSKAPKILDLVKENLEADLEPKEKEVYKKYLKHISELEKLVGSKYK